MVQTKMNIIVTGKQMDVGASLRSYVEGHIDGIVDKYFENTIDSIDGTVTMSKNAHLHRADCNVHLGHGVYLQTSAEEKDVYAAFAAVTHRGRDPERLPAVDATPTVGGDTGRR